VSGYATLNQLFSTASENRFTKMLLNAARELRHRWLVLRFGRRLYDQACGTQSAVVDSPRTVSVQDFSEHLFRRSVSPRIHDLVQLRVASLIASAAQTKLRADLCREQGWSSEQIGAALLGTKSGCFSESEALLLQYAADMTRTPIDVDPQVIRELRVHFTEAELEELTVSIAHENLRARFVEANAKLRLRYTEAGMPR
jgi:alkylhydroperoxidase family enzyme